MSKTNAFEDNILDHIFTNTDITLIGDAAGVLGSATAGSLYIALAEGDPGEAGDLVTNELTLAEYGQYARVAVARSTAGWIVSGTAPTQVSNDAAVTFAEMTTGTGVTASYFAICTGSTIATDDALYIGTLTTPLAISNNITPSFAIGVLVIEEA